MNPTPAGPRLGAVLLVCLSAFPPQAGGASAESPCLIRIGTDEPARLRPLTGGSAPPVRILDGYALAWGPERSVGEIRSAGLEAECLGPRQTGRLYTVVYDRGRPGDPTAPSLENLGRVLWAGPHTAILEYVPAVQKELWSHYATLPILDRPVALPATSPRLRASPPLAADLTIAAYVSQVDLTHLQETIQRLQDLYSRRSYEAGGVQAQDYIAGLFRSYGLTDVSLFDYNDWCDDVVAVQRGALYPDEIYIICGHYDSTSSTDHAPGADDNATGTAAVCEAARLFAPRAFEATLIYLAVSGEEQGLVGSDRWAGWARDHHYDIRGVINLDMVGWRQGTDPADIDLIWNEASRPLRDLTLSAVQTYLPDYAAVDGYLVSGNSDQQSFWDHGYPAILLHEDSDTKNPSYHSSSDRLGVSVNDLPFLRHNVQTAVATLATLARPVRIRIVHTPLDDPPAEVDGYPVRVRILSLDPLVPDSLQIRYRVDGRGVPPLTLAAEGDSGDYAAIIPRQDPGQVVEYEIYARDQEGRWSSDPLDAPARMYRFVVGHVPVLRDGFTGDAGWTVGGPEDDAVSGRWVRARPIPTEAQPDQDAEPDSSDLCYITGNAPPDSASGAADVDGGRTTLTSPRFDLLGARAVQIEYWRWFVDDRYPDDTLRVLLSHDDGVNWIPLEEVTQTEKAWTPVRFEHLEDLLSPTSAMRLRFVVADVGRPSLLEAGVDGVAVKAVRGTSSLPPPSASTNVVRLWPNPFRGELHIVYDLAGGRRTRLKVFDTLGRSVAELPVDGTWSGRHQTVWDGRDARGASVPSGLYFLRLESDGTSAAVRRFLVVR